VLTDGAMDTYEGCASVCDANGRLLFYTNGVTVWNKHHQPMPNGTGLLGNSSTTQSALVIKKPSSEFIYYLFTVDAGGRINGLRYSEIDMRLQGGDGDVTAVKNMLIHTPTCEK
jgi:hypothetical protein